MICTKWNKNDETDWTHFFFFFPNMLKMIRRIKFCSLFRPLTQIKLLFLFLRQKNLIFHFHQLSVIIISGTPRSAANPLHASHCENIRGKEIRFHTGKSWEDFFLDERLSFFSTMLTRVNSETRKLIWISS